ncbi:MAG TPA: NAD(P)/FAD-dependent oxidoreductase [Chitinophagaceae bacterium]
MGKIFRKPENIIIVGGGVAGLMIARELSAKGFIVTILEVDNRLGGRVHTIRGLSFSQPVEKGVEFIHGNLPITIQLLKEAGIEYTPVGGEMGRIENGEWKTQEDFAIDWYEIMKKMNEVRDDLTMDEFLEKNFSDKRYEDVKKSILRFAEGFDVADTSKASVLALREEWMGEEDKQYRIPGGYDQLTNYLKKQCLECGCIIHTSSLVYEIQWEPNNVTVKTKTQVYYSNKVIVTVSLGALLNNRINFQPAIPLYMNAAERIGFGTVVKVMLEFKDPFWVKKKRNPGFFFSDEIIPTWWTQAPSSYPLLTGWAGGPQAWPLQGKDDQSILELALSSLSNIFKKSVDELKVLLSASLVANWKKDPFAAGAYSYSFVNSVTAQKLFRTPIHNTLFFAGEAYYDGPSPGTVEAALTNGRDVARTILEGS